MVNPTWDWLKPATAKSKILTYDNGLKGAVPRLQAPAPILVIHATDVDESVSMEPMARRIPYGPNAWWNRKREMLQFIHPTKTSYALVGLPGGLESNHAGHVYQVEVHTKAAEAANFSDQDLRNLAADVVVPWHKATGGLLKGFRNGTGANLSYGKNAPSRMSYTDWINRTGGDYGTWGICLHANAPLNEHWDAPFRVHDLVWFALEILEEERKAAEPKPKPVIVLPPLPQEIIVPVHGNLDAVGSLKPNKIFVAGWAAESAEPMEIQVTVGSNKPVLLADKPRGDVGAAFPEFGSNHGYYVEVDAPGGFMVDVYVQAGNRSWSKPCYVLPDVKTVSEAPSIDVEAIVDRVVTEAVADIQERLAA